MLKPADAPAAAWDRSLQWHYRARELSGRGSWCVGSILWDCESFIHEYCHGNHKITIYISADGAEYVRVWGPGAFNEMDDGEANDEDTIRMLWDWLTGEDEVKP